MIGKADIPDRSGLLFLPDPVNNSDLFELLPHGQICQMMHQVVVHIVRAQTAQFLAKIAVQGRMVPDQILRQLGRDIDLLPDMVPLEDFPHGSLAARIDIGCVKIIDPGAVSSHQLFLCFVQINAGAFSGKAHTAVAQNAQIFSLSVFPVLHRTPPCICVNLFPQRPYE